MDYFSKNIEYVGKALFMYKNNRGFSKAKIAKMLLCTDMSIKRWLEGKTPPVNTLKIVAKIISDELNITPPLNYENLVNRDISKIVSSEGKRARYNDLKETIISEPKGVFNLNGKDYFSETKYIPVLNKIPKGENINYSEIFCSSEFVYDYICSNIRDMFAFAIKMSYDCMEPFISVNDYIIISPSAEIKNGDISVIRIDDETIIISRVYFQEPYIIARPENNNYLPKLFDLKKINIIGKVVEVIKKL